MTTIPATRAFSIQTIYGGRWSRIFCLLGMLCVSDMAVAAKSGHVESYVVPSWICRGERLPIRATIRNTGDVVWDQAYGGESCGVQIDHWSWPYAIDAHLQYATWDIPPGEAVTFDLLGIDAGDLPSSAGSYSFQISGFYCVEAYPEEVFFDESPSTVSFRIIDPVSWWDGGVSMGDGWRWLDWLGMFFGPTGGWVFHPEHGWLYAVGTSPADVWFWDDQLGWFWTSHLIYPDIYVSDQQRWFCYAKGSTSPRWFYRYGFLDGVAMEWIDGDWVFYGGFTGTGFLAD